MQVHRLDTLLRGPIGRLAGERLTQALADCVQLLTRAARWRDVLDTVVVRYCEAAGVDRISVYRFVEKDGKAFSQALRLAHWAAPGLDHGGPSELFERLALSPDHPLVRQSIARLLEGQAVQLLGERTPDALREALVRRSVRSAFVMPLFDGKRLWGLLVTAYVSEERGLQPHELMGLQTFADVLGASITRASGQAGEDAE